MIQLGIVIFLCIIAFVAAVTDNDCKFHQNNKGDTYHGV